MTTTYDNRRHAGRELADELESYADDDTIILGLPRGGVPVAYECAKKLRAPLDVFVVRKLGVPSHPELAMGAIASGGTRVLNEDIIRQLDLSDAAIERVEAQERDELHRREELYRGKRGAPDLEGKTAILVDDGMATGATMHAAVRALRKQNPRKIIVAVPAASRDSRDLVKPLVDAFVALQVPRDFGAVGRWYREFGQTNDDEVRALLEKANTHDAIATSNNA